MTTTTKKHICFCACYVLYFLLCASCIKKRTKKCIQLHDLFFYKRWVRGLVILTVIGISGYSREPHGLMGNVCSKDFGVSTCVFVWAQYWPARPVWPVDELWMEGQSVEVPSSWVDHDLNLKEQKLCFKFVVLFFFFFSKLGWKVEKKNKRRHHLKNDSLTLTLEE